MLASQNMIVNPPLLESTAATPDSRDRFAIGTSLFVRLLALIHLIAFASFWSQWRGLVGPQGISPATRYFNAVHEQLGASAYLRLPSLCWWFGTETFLPLLCVAGVLLSVMLFAGIAQPFCLALLWLGYLTVCSAGQTFFNFQWDALLLEATLIAVFLAPWTWKSRGRTPEPPRAARWLLWWLLFRLMFLGGLVKLTSGDTAWRDFTALTFHFETQPLPTPLAWYAHQLPLWWHRAECVGMFVLELFVPFFLFAPRGLRHNAALLLAAFMAGVALTGNYTFFNLLAIALCVACLDDAWWLNALPRRLRPRCHLTDDIAKPGPAPGTLLHDHSEAFHPIGEKRRASGFARPPQTIAATAFAVVAGGYTAIAALPVMFPSFGAPAGFEVLEQIVGPTRSFNNYGLFAVMTRPRTELIFEGSDDGRTWRAYEFPHKPGDLQRRPTWVAPHQPRLDWQLWFAALGSLDQNPWVLSLAEHLLRGTPEVLALLQRNPFPQNPPRYVRVVRYEYHFTDAAARARTGQWWRRTPLDVYLPPASLR
jgi:hypothetical protein